MNKIFSAVVSFCIIVLCIVSCDNTGDQIVREVSQKTKGLSANLFVDETLNIEHGTLKVVSPSLVDGALKLNLNDEDNIRLEIVLKENKFNANRLDEKTLDLSSWFVFSDMNVSLSDVKLSFVEKKDTNGYDKSRMFLDFSIKALSLTDNGSFSLVIPSKIGDIRVLEKDVEVITNLIPTVVAELKATLVPNKKSAISYLKKGQFSTFNIVYTLENASLKPTKDIRAYIKEECSSNVKGQYISTYSLINVNGKKAIKLHFRPVQVCRKFRAYDEPFTIVLSKDIVSGEHAELGEDLRATFTLTAIKR